MKDENFIGIDIEKFKDSTTQEKADQISALVKSIISKLEVPFYASAEVDEQAYLVVGKPTIRSLATHIRHIAENQPKLIEYIQALKDKGFIHEEK